MLTLNGHKFAKNDAEFVESLFSDRTCMGYYRKTKGGIKLTDHQRKPFAFIVNNHHDEQFVVSCHVFNGKTRYLFALSTIDEKRLGFDKLSYSESINAAQSAIQSLEESNNA